MSEAIATFVGPSPRQPGDQLTYSLSFVRGGHPILCTDSLSSIWPSAVAARANLEAAWIAALRGGSPFPDPEATLMHGTLGWHQALADLLAASPSALRLMLSREAARLLPELCPVPQQGGTRGWLDRALPIYRSLHHVPRAARPRQPELTLAVLYQDLPEFEAEAHDLRGALDRDFDAVDLFNGARLINPALRMRGLQEIFFGHRAVLFLGHLAAPGSGYQGGWCLTDQAALSIAELTALLAQVAAVIPSRASTARHALYVPELIVTGCCAGGWGAAGADGTPNEFFYPEVFLDGGVRCFVGTWMEVMLRGPQGWSDHTTLLRDFLQGWRQDPDAAPQALFAAKRACSDPLLASLFQIYVAPELPATTAVSAVSAPVPPPARPLSADLKPDTRLGAYRLLERLWEDPWAVAFRADRPDTGGRYLLQVLADEWQDRVDLQDLLQGAIATLAQAALPASQLIPTRLEALPRGEDTAAPTLWTLVYDRPPDENATAWLRLADWSLDTAAPQHFQRVLELGAAISRCLADLHAQGVLHGNFDPAAVLLRQCGEQVQIMIKDAWVRWVQTGRCTHPRYAAPDALEAGEPGARLKVDCFGLGVLMFELATGQPKATPDVSLRTTLGARQGVVPEALDRVVCECLAPVAAVRPAADQIARRLALAVSYGGTYLGDLAQQFDLHIAAGHRLFVVRVDRMEDVQGILSAMAAAPQARFRYRLYEAAEGEGVRDCRLGPVLPWIDGADIRAAIMQQTGQDPGPIQAATQCYVNAAAMFGWLNGLAPGASGPGAEQRPELPILLLRGAAWWQIAPSMADFLGACRTLKATQRERGYPVVIIADSQLLLPADADIPFLFIDFPPPAPSELFERVLSAPPALGCPPLDPELAAMIADRLFPCTARELDEALRLCAIRDGRIDERLVDVRDADRARRFRGFGPLAYTPWGQLPPFHTFGWPPAQAPGLADWCAAQRGAGIGARCLLLTGPAGYGKSAAPRALAAGLQRPLFRLDAAGCLQRNLGASEQALASNLDMVANLGAAVLLLDDLHRLVSATDGTLTRMAGILSHWMDHLPPQIVVIATAPDAAGLSAPWRRRFAWTIALNAPPLDQRTQDSLGYRAQVIGALFRRFGLGHLAADTDLLDALAWHTCPTARTAPLKDPLARLRPAGPLGGCETRLVTGADLEAWMADTMQLFIPVTGPDAPAEAGFWRAAAL